MGGPPAWGRPEVGEGAMQFERRRKREEGKPSESMMAIYVGCLMKLPAGWKLKDKRAYRSVWVRHDIVTAESPGGDPAKVLQEIAIQRLERPPAP
jgi:hypothetical protein